MKKKYKGQIKVLMGIEMGMQSHIYDQLNELISDYHFDFVLASNHLGQGVDPYQPIYFKYTSKKDNREELLKIDMRGCFIVQN
jgi:histidinol-phosphatase (PHP family)